MSPITESVKIACMCLIYEIECLNVITAYLDLLRISALGQTQLFSVSCCIKWSRIKCQAENNCRIIRYGKNPNFVCSCFKAKAFSYFCTMVAVMAPSFIMTVGLPMLGLRIPCVGMPNSGVSAVP